jgi:hypothetical protein
MTTNRPRRSWTAALWAVAVVLLVAGSGFAVWRFTKASGGAADAQAGANAAPPRLVRGNDYYLCVKIIELADHAPNGSVWDRVDGSGPDIRFNLTWRGNIVWDASVKKDTLIGSWDLMKIDLRQVIASGGQAELEGALNAPLIHYEPGETVLLTVWDEDALTSYDEAGKVLLKLDDLGPGQTSLATPALLGGADAKAVKRVVLSLIDRRTSVPDLIQAMSNR